MSSTQLTTALKRIYDYLLLIAQYDHLPLETTRKEFWDGQITKTFIMYPDESIENLATCATEELGNSQAGLLFTLKWLLKLLNSLDSQTMAEVPENEAGDHIRNLRKLLITPGRLLAPRNSNKIKMGVFDVSTLITALTEIKILLYFFKNLNLIKSHCNKPNFFERWLSKRVLSLEQLGLHPEKAVQYINNLPPWDKMPPPTALQKVVNPKIEWTAWQQIWHYHQLIAFKNRIGWLTGNYRPLTVSLNLGPQDPQRFYHLLFWLHLPIILDCIYYVFWKAFKLQVKETLNFVYRKPGNISWLDITHRLTSQIIKILLAPFLIAGPLVQGFTSLPFTYLRLTFLRNIRTDSALNSGLRGVEFAKDSALFLYSLAQWSSLLAYFLPTPWQVGGFTFSSIFLGTIQIGAFFNYWEMSEAQRREEDSIVLVWTCSLFLHHDFFRLINFQILFLLPTVWLACAALLFSARFSNDVLPIVKDCWQPLKTFAPTTLLKPRAPHSQHIGSEPKVYLNAFNLNKPAPLNMPILSERLAHRLEIH